MSEGVTDHDKGDREVPCAECGQPISVAASIAEKSSEVYCGPCFKAVLTERGAEHFVAAGLKDRGLN